MSTFRVNSRAQSNRNRSRSKKLNARNMNSRRNGLKKNGKLSPRKETPNQRGIAGKLLAPQSRVDSIRVCSKDHTWNSNHNYGWSLDTEPGRPGEIRSDKDKAINFGSSAFAVENALNLIPLQFHDEG